MVVVVGAWQRGVLGEEHVSSVQVGGGDSKSVKEGRGLAAIMSWFRRQKGGDKNLHVVA